MRPDDLPIQLRGGFETTDRRLDRLPQFDPQSRDFPVRALLRAAEIKKPRGYTWQVPLWLDQGNEGACVGFSMTHELAARPVRVSDLSPDYALGVYWEAQHIDPWEGGAYPGADPHYDGTSVLAGAKVLQRRGAFTEYRWAFGLDDLVLAVGYAGPAVLGINWWTGMFTPDDDGFVHPAGSIAGGHAILCNRVNFRERFFGLWNSWGPQWGSRGQCRVSFDDMEKLLNDGGEAMIPVHRQRMKEG